MDFVSQITSLIAAHEWAGLGGLLCMVFVTLLTDRAKFLPTWDNPLRPFLGTLVGAAGLILNRAQDGDSNVAMVVSVVATSLPTLLAELTLVLKKPPPATPAPPPEAP